MNEPADLPAGSFVLREQGKPAALLSEPTALCRDLDRLQGSIWRHEADKPPVLLCMATRLATDYVVTVYDQGVDGFESKPPSWDVESREAWRSPQHRFSDLRLHSLYPGHPNDTVEWLYWASPCPLQPLVFLGTTEHAPETATCTAIAPMHTLLAREYPQLWRIGYGQGILANRRFELERCDPRRRYVLHVHEGCLIHDVHMMYFRGGADNLHQSRSLVGHANFNYPGPIDYGAPVVDAHGDLAGVLVGGELGPESSHQGAYVPTDFIAPLLLREHMRRRSYPKWDIGHHAVVHHEDAA